MEYTTAGQTDADHLWLEEVEEKTLPSISYQFQPHAIIGYNPQNIRIC